MAKRYFISGAVANGDFFTEEMSADFTDSELSYIIFYSDQFQTVVTPTAGTITYTQSADGIHYREMSDGTFDATTSYDAARTPPSGTGLAAKGKVSMTGVTGATHFTACVWRS
jgi:hypothetical protein